MQIETIIFIGLSVVIVAGSFLPDKFWIKIHEKGWM